MTDLAADLMIANAEIEVLKAENAILRQRLDNECDSCACEIANERDLRADLIESLQAQLAESRRRADAAVEDLESLHGENSLCRICKHFNVDVECSPCADCKGNPHIIVSEFEWRGTEKGEADERD